MASREAVDSKLLELFEAERTVRRLHDELTQMPEDELIDRLSAAAQAAAKESRPEEAALRLSRIASLLGEFEGPRVVDALVDVLGSEHPEARLAAGEELEELSFERFKEVAQGVERALKRLPVGSPALPELPYILAQVPEPGVVKLIGRFLEHEDADAVAAAIEAMVEVGDGSAAKLLAALVEDKRTVELAEEDSERTEEVTIGELAEEAIDLLEGGEDDDDEPAPSHRGRA